MTNSRSIENKIESVYDIFDELDISIAIVTETWSKNDNTFERIKERSLHEKGITIIHKHRPGTKKGGGVFVMARNKFVTMSKYKLNSRKHEVVAAKGKITGSPRPLYVFALYLSTALKKSEADAALEMVNEEILKVKTKENNPIFIVGFVRINQNVVCLHVLSNNGSPKWDYTIRRKKSHWWSATGNETR